MSWSAIKAARALAPAAALGILVGACSDIYYDRRDTIAFSAGDAIAADQAIQVLDPWPRLSENRAIRFNGDKMQTAAARYRTGKVIQPKSIITSPEVSQGSGNSTPEAPPPQ